MENQFGRRIHPRLTFDEVNIVYVIIKTAIDNAKPITKTDFHQELDKVKRHTTDSCILGSIESLDQKIRNLSYQEFEQLCQDVATGKILFPENYHLPSL